MFVIQSISYFAKRHQMKNATAWLHFISCDVSRITEPHSSSCLFKFCVHNTISIRWNGNIKRKHQCVVLNLCLLVNKCSIVSTFFYIDIGSKIMQNFYWLYSMCINVRLRYKKKWIQSYFYFFIIYLIWPLVVLKHDGSSHDFINATLATNLDS